MWFIVKFLEGLNWLLTKMFPNRSDEITNIFGRSHVDHHDVAPKAAVDESAQMNNEKIDRPVVFTSEELDKVNDHLQNAVESLNTFRKQQAVFLQSMLDSGKVEPGALFRAETTFWFSGSMIEKDDILFYLGREKSNHEYAKYDYKWLVGEQVCIIPPIVLVNNAVFISKEDLDDQ